MHAVWDTCLIEHHSQSISWITHLVNFITFTPPSRASDRLFQNITEASKVEWASSEPFQWAAESYAIATSPELGYCTWHEGSCWYDLENQRLTLKPGEKRRTFNITDSYITTFAPIAENRLSQAGIRLSKLINLALIPD
ncbi:MAG: hypothetical protein GKR96_14375 [Gammaproteobacteria bacterium]|nr:hypothetical protein [Gammaproteobacteria bacterium]